MNEKLTFIDKGTLRGIAGLNLPTNVDRDHYKGAAATVDSALRERMTATRLAVLGPLALAAKKRTAQAFVTVRLADGSEYVSQPVKDEHKARTWAARFNTWTAKLGG